MTVLEESSRRVSVASLGKTLDFADKGAVDRIARHSLETLSVDINTQRFGTSSYLHHAEMLTTVVSLEECVASPAFDENTAKGPQVNRV